VLCVCVKVTLFVFFIVKFKLCFIILCFCAIWPGKAVPEMTYTVSDVLNPFHSLTHLLYQYFDFRVLRHHHRRFCFSL